MRKIKTEDDPVLTAIKEGLREILSKNARQIILFGSRARGDAERDSDYDILFLVDKKSRLLEDKVDGITYEMLERYGVVVTIFVHFVLKKAGSEKVVQVMHMCYCVLINICKRSRVHRSGLPFFVELA